jgi:hypothetical protein
MPTPALGDRQRRGGRARPVPLAGRIRATSAASIALVILFSIACAHQPRAGELTRERAIATARAQVRFEPFEIDARRTRADGRRIWRVILKGRLPGQPPMLFETAVVEIDAVTGSLVSVAKPGSH